MRIGREQPSEEFPGSRVAIRARPITVLLPALAVFHERQELAEISDMKYIRLYAGPDGESHFEDVEVDLIAPLGTPQRAAGSRAQASAVFPTSTMRFVLIPPGGSPPDWHPAPQRQFVIMLEGEGEFQASDGEIRRIGPGGVLLVEDTSGKGHLSRTVGDGIRLMAWIPLPE